MTWRLAKMVLGLVVLAMGSVSAVAAQERAAASSVNPQVNVGAINSNVKGVSTKVEQVNNRVDEMVVCGKKNMIYAPGANGADTNGCLYAGLSPSTTMIINNINACARTGSVYSDTTKSCIQPDKPRWYMVGAISNLNGIPACGGAQGSVARLCANPSDRCYKSTTSSYTTEQQCKQTGDTGGWEGCWGGGTVTTTTHYLYACE